MVGLVSVDHLADVLRDLQANLGQAARAADRLQQYCNAHVAAGRSRENTGFESCQPCLRETTLGSSNASCIDLSDRKAFPVRGSTAAVAGSTLMMQMQQCSGDAPPADVSHHDYVEEEFEDVDVMPPAAGGLTWEICGEQATSRANSARSQMVLHLRGAWCELSPEDLQVCHPNFQPSIMLQPASDSDLYWPLTRAWRMSQHFMNTSAVSNIKKLQVDRFMFDPDDTIHLIWTLPAIGFVAYDTVTVPLQAFHAFIDGGFGVWVFELCIAIYWTLDIAVSFRTGFFRGTVLEMHPRMVAKKYMKTWCAFDVVLMLMEWITQFVSSYASVSVVRVTRVLRYVRVARLLRLIKIPMLWKLIEDQISTNLQHLIFSAIETVLIFLVLLHAVTCAWYAIGAASPNGWTSYDKAAREDNTLFFWYFASSRWVLAQINGRTDMNDQRNMQERFFTCVVAIVFAVIFMSIFLSSMTATILQFSDLSQKRSEARRKMNEYLQHHRVPLSLVASVKRQMLANTAITILRENAEREQQVLAQLPEHLQFDLLYEIRAPVLVRHAFLRELDLAFPRVVRRICLAAVRPAIAHHDQDVFHVGDPCSRMIFVDKGQMVYSQRDTVSIEPSCDFSFPAAPVRPTSMQSTETTRSTKICKMQKAASADNGQDSEWKVYTGMWLSEAALWVEWENQGRLVASEDSLLMALDSGDLAHTLLAYRDAYALSAIYARRFSEVLREQQQQPSDLMKVDADFGDWLDDTERLPRVMQRTQSSPARAETPGSESSSRY